ncbi:uncharacterized protein LOC132256225 [Phlebotomus argentipes]|uniref:uncharacterized protein LOC132256225 n=1 Tax=Phlebotomus argentipes TaxID=94469 RepID=UPI0028929B32|nr:uncharacterized protein LOC132256225 [Phlebotomus argentipes]
MRLGVVLDSENGIYFAGDKITGEVTVDVERPQALKMITVMLRGIAKIAFREGAGLPFFLATNNLCYDQQTIMSREVIVFANSNPSPVMEKGSYSFGFSFLLPNLMVSSFKSSHGYVTYTLDIVAKKRFFVERLHKELKIFEFNEDTPQLSYRPLKFEKVILPRLSCLFRFFLQREDITARCHIHIPRITFYSGESIDVNVVLMDYQVGNRGKSAVIITELLQEFAFQGGFSSRSLVEPRRAIAMKKTKDVKAYHQLIVPPCPRTGGVYRRARVGYYVRVRVQMRCRQYHLLIPITLTGPLNDMSRKWQSHYEQHDQSSVSSEPELAPAESMQRHAVTLLQLLTTKKEHCTSMEGLDIPQSVPEVGEDFDEVDMIEKIRSTPDSLVTLITPPESFATHPGQEHEEAGGDE